MLGVMKNDFSELQRRCQKPNTTSDSCLLFVNRGRNFEVYLFRKAINMTSGLWF